MWHECKKAIGIASVLVILVATLSVGDFVVPAFAAQAKTVDMVMITDLHSYLASYDVTSDDGTRENIGGVARIATVLQEEREKNPGVLALDAGDIAMGTLYQTLYSEEALELSMLGRLRFDATTFGNHDFDYGTAALSSMFEAAAAKSDYLPAFCICNADWNASNDATRQIKASLDKCNVCDYMMFDKNGVNIAVIGVFGVGALKDAPTCELTFTDPSEAVQRTIATIKSQENADMIVLVSHCGTTGDPGESEDEMIAKANPEIDVLLSGHSHIEIVEPIVCDNTYILSPGCYGENVALCNLTQRDDGRWDLNDYSYVRLDSSVEEDPEILDVIDDYDETIDREYLSLFDMTADKVIAENDVTFGTVDDLYDNHDEENLGDIISDAYRYAANQTPAGQSHPVDVTISPAGTIRGSYVIGDITAKQVYESFSLGSGADGTAGYPLLDLYLYGKELKTLCEVDASVSDLMNSARLYMSGLSFTYNPHRMILSKVEEAHLSPTIMGDDYAEIEDDKLYHVVTDMYSGRMLGAVTDMSKGILSVVPKDENGVPVPMINGDYDYDSAIIHNADGSEVKAWVAIADYMRSFPKGENGISRIPSYYASNEHGRKVVDDSFNPMKLFKNTSVLGWVIYLIIALVAAGLILLICKIVKSVRKHAEKGRKEVLGE